MINMKTAYRAIMTAVLALTLTLTNLCACSSTSYPDRSEEYPDFFTEEDSQAEKDVKNMVIGMMIDFNAGKFDNYMNAFSLSSEDRQASLNTYQQLDALYDQSFSILNMDATALTETDAQVYFAQETKNVLRQTGELEVHYLSYLLYTMKKEDGQWKVVDQKQENIVHIEDTAESD